MGTELMVDSGAFSAFTQKKRIEIGEYIDYIKINSHLFQYYFNLDVIGNGEKSYNNWIHMRSNGLNPIPVYHIGTDEWYLKQYLQQVDYIALGAIADMSTERRLVSLDRIWMDYLTDFDGMPTVKVHGFGLTSIRVMRMYPWFSTDSTSWVMFGRYGAILVPKKSDGDYIYDENPFIVTVSSVSPKQSKIGHHFSTYSEEVQKSIIEYVKYMGFEIGESEYEINDKGKMKEKTRIKDGLCNVHYQRDQINMLYYIGVQNSLPKWPWQLNLKSTNQVDLF